VIANAERSYARPLAPNKAGATKRESTGFPLPPHLYSASISLQNSLLLPGFQLAAKPSVKIIARYPQ